MDRRVDGQMLEATVATVRAAAKPRRPVARDESNRRQRGSFPQRWCIGMIEGVTLIPPSMTDRFPCRVDAPSQLQA
jgi:hypothetical protein